MLSPKGCCQSAEKYTPEQALECNCNRSADSSCQFAEKYTPEQALECDSNRSADTRVRSRMNLHLHQIGAHTADRHTYKSSSLPPPRAQTHKHTGGWRETTARHWRTCRAHDADLAAGRLHRRIDYHQLRDRLPQAPRPPTEYRPGSGGPAATRSELPAPHPPTRPAGNEASPQHNHHRHQVQVNPVQHVPIDHIPVGWTIKTVQAIQSRRRRRPLRSSPPLPPPPPPSPYYTDRPL